MKEYKNENRNKQNKCRNKWEQLSEQDPIKDEQIFTEYKQICKREIL
jgi:hypothetical protein